MSDISFYGRVAVVTGGGGGLGRSYSLELARRGARVIVNDLGGSVDGSGSGNRAADAVVEEIVSAGGEAIPNYDSVSSPEGGEAIIGAAIDAFGKGAFYVSMPAFKVMKENSYGRFVHTSSNSGIFGNFGQSNYGAAKMGLVGLSNVLAIEGSKYGIQSNVIGPVARTRMTEQLLGPLAELVSPDQVMPMVVFLASEANPYTHEIFTAGGGRYGRIFIGTNPGWFAGPKVVPSVEEIQANIDQIRDVSSYEIPASSNEEIMIIARNLGG